MVPRRWLVSCLLGAAVLLGFGLSRLQLDVDIFNLLPTDSGVVQGLQTYQRNFGSSRELLVTLRSPDAEQAEAAAVELIASLQEAQLTSRVIWRSPFRDAEALGELLAYLWLGRDPQEFSEMAARFGESRIDEILAETLDRLSISFRPDEVARLANDPFELSSITESLGSALPSSIEAQSGAPFVSEDGLRRILFVEPPFEEGGFFTLHRWVRETRAHVEAWQSARQGETTARITGNPAFVSEAGSGLLRDMQLAALGTLLLVAALFWRTHRRWLPLLWLVGLLIAVLTATVAAGSLFLGTLNAVSLGFAAILLGLAADYGLILYQELIAEPRRPVREHQRRIAPSIFWASVTTAGAFLVIGRSSLPGLSQLGILVGLGILIAAGVMLLFFLPPIAALVAAAHDGQHRDERVSGRGAGWATLALVGLTGLLLAFFGLPTVDESTRDLGPKKGEARQALDEVKDLVGGVERGVWLLVSGDDDAQVGERLQALDGLLQQMEQRGDVRGFLLPEALWARAGQQQANHRAAAELASRIDPVSQAAAAAGFAPGSLQLTRSVFTAWEGFAARLAAGEDVVWPQSPGARWLVRQFAASQGDTRLAVGRLEVSQETTAAELTKLDEYLQEVPGTQLFSWRQLSEALLERMQGDLRRVVWPMAVALVVLLGLAFRRIPEIVLSLAVLAFSLGAVLAVMATVGWSWNLMNIMALPLLFGAGVDYSIHTQLALQRHGGSLTKVRQTVGRAILLCSASTASGFGTLAFASNAGLASLGRVCAVGIVVTGLISVFLLPVWWRTLSRKSGVSSEDGE